MDTKKFFDIEVSNVFTQEHLGGINRLSEAGLKNYKAAIYIRWVCDVAAPSEQAITPARMQQAIRAWGAGQSLGQGPGFVIFTELDPVNGDMLRVIEDEWLSVRTVTCLTLANIRFVCELVTKTEAELLKLKNFGPKSLREIKAYLAEMDLRLREDT